MSRATFSNQTTPATPAAGTTTLFIDSADKHAKTIDDAGTVEDLTDPLPDPHASRHILGGADEIDADQLDIDFTPANYVPTTTPPEATNLDHLAAHLAGIDTKLGTAVSNRSLSLNVRQDAGSPTLFQEVGFDGFELRDGQTDGVITSARLPLDVDLSTVNPLSKYYFIIKGAAGAGTDVRLELSVRLIAVGENSNKAVSEFFQTTATLTNTDRRLHEVVFTHGKANFAAGDYMTFEFKRLGTDAADDFQSTIVVAAQALFEYGT